MACIENVTGGHCSSPTVVTTEKNGTKELRHEVPLQRPPNSKLKDDTENWGLPRNPLRPPFSTLTDLERRKLENPADSSGALRHPYVLQPAILKESLAAEVNSSQGLESQSQKGQNYVNVSEEAFGGPQKLMVGGIRANRVSAKRGDSSSRPFGSFPPSSPQVRGPPYSSTLRSGVVMEIHQRISTMACSGRLAHVSFFAGALVPSMDNWPRPIHLSSSAPGLLCSAHGFISPPPPRFKPFLCRPISYVAPPVFGPPMSPYFVHLHAGQKPLSASSNREFK